MAPPGIITIGLSSNDSPLVIGDDHVLLEGFGT